MEKKIYYILGTVFIITSGLIYTFERFAANYLSPSGHGEATSQGSIVTYTMTLKPSLFSNLFIAIFIVIGVIFFARGYAKK